MSNQSYIKSFTRNLVQIVGGPKEAVRICNQALEKAGADSKVTLAEVSYWCNDAHDRFIPLDHFIDLDAAAGGRGLKELAQKAELEAARINAKPNRAQSILRTIAELSRRAGDLEYTTIDAAEDGELTPAETRRILDRAEPLKNIIHQLVEVVT
jgi:hypothetical protein